MLKLCGQLPQNQLRKQFPCVIAKRHLRKTNGVYMIFTFIIKMIFPSPLPIGINKYLEITFHDVIAEPDSASSVADVWKWSKVVFDNVYK